MTDRRDIGRDDTQPPWDGVTERRTRASMPESPAGEEALHEVRALHRSLHGEGSEQGVFERLRSVSRSQDDMAQQMYALETKVEGFDHKLDEMLRAAKEELRLAKEETRLAKERAEQQPPLWVAYARLASVAAIAAFFVQRLWHEIVGR